MVELYRDSGLDIYEKAHYSHGEHIAEVEQILAWYLPRKARVLDVGCSGGLHALEFASRGFLVTGFDIEPSATSRAEKRAKDQKVQAEFRALDLEKDDISSHRFFRSTRFFFLWVCRTEPGLPQLSSIDQGGGMKLFNIRDFYQEKYKEYIIGSKEIEKHTVYLVYGEVSHNQRRRMTPDGHDEILLLLSGEAVLENEELKTVLKKEQAVYMGPNEAFAFTALADCRYVIAGTHPVPHTH